MTEEITNAEVLLAINKGFDAQTAHVREELGQSENRTGVLIEKVSDDVKFVAESVASLDKRMSAIDERMSAIEKSVSVRQHIEALERANNVSLEDIFAYVSAHSH